uniref:CRAL-TRIO domain-containing protein n=1 Tax=Chaetoceros debilis TaxID=122233 RepID=A0A7S3V561_9STRA
MGFCRRGKVLPGANTFNLSFRPNNQFVLVKMPPKEEMVDSVEPDALNLTGLKSALEKVEDTIQYTSDELKAMREVKQCLEKDGVTYVNARFLAYTVIVYKCRVDESTAKYKQFLKATAQCGMEIVEPDETLWNDPEVETFLRSYYAPCGVDSEGRQILWITGGKNISEELEKTSIRAGLLYTMAVHGDSKSLREGITFVIDLSKRKKSKNGSKMQKINQSYPLRPQAIYLAGASKPMRVIINGLIKIASLFTKQKVIGRVKFLSIEQAMDSVSKESGPEYLGGGGGGIDDVFEWTKMRYESLPIPNL